MSKGIPVTIIGNLTADPELRTIASGASVVNFTIAQTDRSYNKQSQQYEDGDTVFLRCSAWRQLAINITQSLTKGMPVIAHGGLSQRSYQTQSGENRTVMELQVDSIGPNLTASTAVVTRTKRGETPAHSAPSAPVSNFVPPDTDMNQDPDFSGFAA
jgi:single-strand DNA-binding protein